MRTTNSSNRRRSRAAALALAVAAATALAGCGDWLTVTNPSAIENEALDDPGYLQLMYDGVIGDFQPAYAWTALFAGAFTDELRMHHSYFENFEIDQRRVTENNGTYALSVFNGLHRARFLADSVASRYRAILGDTAQNDPRLGRILAFAGYSWTLLGENICETRINAQGAPLQPNELFAGAIQRFEAAIAAATAARTAAQSIPDAPLRDRVIASADSSINLARVGAARAALDMGDNAAAIAYAQAVAPAYASLGNQGFRFDIRHLLDGGRRTRSPFWEFISAGGSWVSLTGTGFENLNDPRIPHMEPGTLSTFGGGAFAVPNAPHSFGTYDGTVEGALFEPDTPMRLASAMEARYILAEAQGNTAQNVAFLNDQRALGNQTPLTNPTDAEYFDALREQRAREFFIDGHRLGDLRRYEALYGVDLWPTGAMYGGSITFGEQKCWPTPVSELF